MRARGVVVISEFVFGHKLSYSITRARRTSVVIAAQHGSGGGASS